MGWPNIYKFSLSKGAILIYWWALSSKYILLFSYFEGLILLVLMVYFFLHITYRNLVEFPLL